MTDETPPVALVAAERARRAFLARVAEALRACAVPDLIWEYRAQFPQPPSQDAPRTVLVARLPDVPDEVQVAAVTAVRHRVTTRPGGDETALEQIRAQARSLGIAAVAGTYRIHEPFPADGTPEFELTIREAQRRGAVATHPADADGDDLLPVDLRYLGDPQAVATVIVEWAQAVRRRTEPSPRGDHDLAALRAIAQARRAALADVDWASVAALRAGGRLVEAWRTAGLAVAFDPDDPEVGIDAPPDRPAAPAVPVAERVARGLAGSGLEAIVDLSVVADLAERLVAAMPWRTEEAAVPAAPAAPAVPTLTPASRAALRDDLAALAPRQLLWHLPRDERGRLLLGERVLLASYETAASLGQGRRLWLIAALPERRRDVPVPTVRLAALIGANHTHRWDQARWLWDTRARAVTTERRWGVADLPPAELGLDAWRGGLAGDPPQATGGAAARSPEVARAAHCLLLQDAGRLAEALALYGVDLAPEVARLVRGEPLGWHQRALAEPWARAVQEALPAAAPWRFGPLLAEAAAERARWLAAKRGRRRPPPALRLLRLPKQTGQSKAVLTLAARDPDGGRPWLTLDWTGSDDRLPAVAWRREPDLDLLRFGLLTPADLPYTL